MGSFFFLGVVSPKEYARRRSPHVILTRCWRDVTRGAFLVASDWIASQLRESVAHSLKATSHHVAGPHTGADAYLAPCWYWHGRGNPNKFIFLIFDPASRINSGGINSASLPPIVDLLCWSLPCVRSGLLAFAKCIRVVIEAG